jgi:hypothetical protein
MKFAVADGLQDHLIFLPNSIIVVFEVKIALYEKNTLTLQGCKEGQGIQFKFSCEKKKRTHKNFSQLHGSKIVIEVDKFYYDTFSRLKINTITLFNSKEEADDSIN